MTILVAAIVHRNEQKIEEKEIPVEMGDSAIAIRGEKKEEKSDKMISTNKKGILYVEIPKAINDK